MDCFGIFAKFWEPGKVKTRLAVALGPDSASQIYCLFVSTLVSRFRGCADSRVIYFTPQEQADAFASLAGVGWIVRPQTQGDLGTRMTSFFEDCFHEGADRVVLIGSDSPTLPVEYVESAFRVLRETDVVLGPTDDGGYYLVGLSRNAPEIFKNIHWSTSSVWEQTVARIGECQLSYQSLPQWYDVDELTDLVRLRDELLEISHDDATLNALLAAIDRAI